MMLPRKQTLGFIHAVSSVDDAGILTYPQEGGVCFHFSMSKEVTLVSTSLFHLSMKRPSPRVCGETALLVHLVRILLSRRSVQLTTSLC